MGLRIMNNDSLRSPFGIQSITVQLFLNCHMLQVNTQFPEN